MSTLPTWTHTAPEYPLAPWPDYFRVLTHPEGNHSARTPADVTVDTVVIHDTATLSVASVLATFNDPREQRSAHALIDRDGTTYLLVPWDKKAWHAGVSAFDGRDDVNEFSVGIELVNIEAPGPGQVLVGHHTLEYTDAQLTSLLALTLELGRLYPAITPERLVGHDAIALPAGRKVDPGPDFPWPAYRAAVAYHLHARRAVA